MKKKEKKKVYVSVLPHLSIISKLTNLNLSLYTGLRGDLYDSS